MRYEGCFFPSVDRNGINWVSSTCLLAEPDLYSEVGRDSSFFGTSYVCVPPPSPLSHGCYKQNKFLLMHMNSYLVQIFVFELNCHLVTPYANCNQCTVPLSSCHLAPCCSLQFSLFWGADFHRKLLGKTSPFFCEATERKRPNVIWMLCI